MKKLLSKLVVLLLVFQLITSTALLTYDPKTDASAISELSKHTNEYKWLYKRTLTAGGFSVESVSYIHDGTNPKVSKFASTPDVVLKAVSDGFSCAVLYDSATPTVLVAKFNVAVATSEEELIASSLANAANASTI